MPAWGCRTVSGVDAVQPETRAGRTTLSEKAGRHLVQLVTTTLLQVPPCSLVSAVREQCACQRQSRRCHNLLVAASGAPWGTARAPRVVVQTEVQVLLVWTGRAASDGDAGRSLHAAVS